MHLSDLLNDRAPRRIGESDCARASVLIPLIPAEDGFDVLFEVRSSRVEHQPGDVCFPGGMREDGETARENAVRETMEELLVSRDQIRILGPSDYLGGGGLIVEPFAGILTGYTGSRSDEEVEEVFIVPLSFFLANEPERHEVEYKVEMPEDFPFHKVQGGRNYAWRTRKEEMLFYEYEGRVIWGMTARILHSFVQIIKKSPTSL